MRTLNLDLELTNVYGGDGFTRAIEHEEVIYEEEDITVTEWNEDQIGGEDAVKETKKRRAIVEVHTFRTPDDDPPFPDGNPLYRLGGTRGKFWGLLREIGYTLYDAGRQKNKVTTDRALRAVQVKPQWCQLETASEPRVDKVRVDLAGSSSGMIMPRYDVIPECRTSITIQHLEDHTELIDMYLSEIEAFGFGNKRRGSITVLNREEE